MHRTKWVVLTRIAGDGWISCWQEDDQPLAFKTKREAQESLDAHLWAIRSASQRGLMSDTSLREDDYMITTLSNYRAHI